VQLKYLLSICIITIYENIAQNDNRLQENFGIINIQKHDTFFQNLLILKHLVIFLLQRTSQIQQNILHNIKKLLKSQKLFRIISTQNRQNLLSEQEIHTHGPLRCIINHLFYYFEKLEIGRNGYRSAFQNFAERG
jgi:hypothetical protein